MRKISQSDLSKYEMTLNCHVMKKYHEIALLRFFSLILTIELIEPVIYATVLTDKNCDMRYRNLPTWGSSPPPTPSRTPMPVVVISD